MERLWTIDFGCVLEKLKNLKKGLILWAGGIRRSKKGTKERLMAKLEELHLGEREKENLAELIDTKVILNWEIEKEEVY